MSATGSPSSPANGTPPLRGDRSADTPGESMMMAMCHPVTPSAEVSISLCKHDTDDMKTFENRYTSTQLLKRLPRRSGSSSQEVRVPLSQETQSQQEASRPWPGKRVQDGGRPRRRTRQGSPSSDSVELLFTKEKRHPHCKRRTYSQPDLCHLLSSRKRCREHGTSPPPHKRA